MKEVVIVGLFAIIVLSSPVIAQGNDASINFCRTYAANAADGTARCQTCYDGYILSSDAKLCNRCPNGCVNCSPTGQCLKCGENYYLAASTGMCSFCPNGCTACGPTGCQGCQAGYFPSGGYCSRCSIVCETCTSVDYCTKCIGNMEVKNGKCQNIQKDGSSVLMTLLIFFIICCLPLIICCFCLSKAGQAAGSAGGFRSQW